MAPEVNQSDIECQKKYLVFKDSAGQRKNTVNDLQKLEANSIKMSMTRNKSFKFTSIKKLLKINELHKSFLFY